MKPRPRIGSHRRTLVVATVVVIAVATGGCSTATTSGGSHHHPSAHHAAGGQLTRHSAGWASPASATLTPGVQTYTGDEQCTANFVFTDSSGNVYLGQAAHCAGTGGSEATNGCRTSSKPLGTAVTFESHGSMLGSGSVLGTGTLAYSSWLAMRQDHETDGSTCAYNDFALVRLASGERHVVNPTVPKWGGPVGVRTTTLAAGETLLSYGNSSIRAGLSPLSPQQGVAQGDDAATHGWTHALMSPTPGIPGDSGSAYLDGNRYAVGTLSTLGFSLPIINNIGDIYHELMYAQRHSGISGLALELGAGSAG